jgi:hypothetical protein
MRRRAAPRDVGSLVNLWLGIGGILAVGFLLGWLVTLVLQ